MKAQLLDEKHEEDGSVTSHTRNIILPSSPPRDIVLNERVTGEKQDNAEYLYRLRGINKQGVASYSYHSTRMKSAGFKPNPRLARGQ